VTEGEVIAFDTPALDAEYVMQTYARLPVTFVRGEGTRLFDDNGSEYLDFVGGLAVVSLGHAHPAVADALADQARTLLHVSNLYYNELQPRLAARLDSLIGGGGRVFFANSGAEANECAIKLARRHGQLHGGPARTDIVTLLGSFHGRTLATLAATGQPEKHDAFQPLPEGFRHVVPGNLEDLAVALDERVCAVMVEPLQAEGGVLPLPPGYLEGVRTLCDEQEALLVVDEVQTGLGRTGKWFGFQHTSVSPDLVTVAKALGNGVPIGACWARADVAGAFRVGDHASTFGGQPLAVRAALSVLDVMEAEDVPTRAMAAGERLRGALAKITGVESVRGAGLLLAAELAAPLDAREVAVEALEVGLVVNAVTPRAVRFAPPLLVTDNEIDDAVARFAAAVARSAT